MYASPLIVVGLGAFAAQALAGGIDTVVDTTVITVSTILTSASNLPLARQSHRRRLVLIFFASFHHPALVSSTNALTSPSDHLLRTRG
jgi:hypothetical protein